MSHDWWWKAIGEEGGGASSMVESLWGCAPQLSLKLLHQQNPSGIASKVCAHSAGVPYEVRYWAHRGSETKTDADPAAAPERVEPTPGPKPAAKEPPPGKPNESKSAAQATPAATNPAATQQGAGQTLGIRNKQLAGQKHPKTGVPFDDEGYPDFRAAGVVNGSDRK